MDNQAKLNDTKKRIIDTCLDEFVKNGLYSTSVRDLASALNMQSSGLYYYFKNKDDIVVACAEEAVIRMEEALLLPILHCIRDDGTYIRTSEELMSQLKPLMQFFAQVCTTNEYRDKMQPVLDQLKKKHAEYSVKFAKELSCEPQEVAPYLYACVALVANYMIFEEETYYKEPFELLVSAIYSLKNRNTRLEEE